LIVLWYSYNIFAKLDFSVKVSVLFFVLYLCLLLLFLLTFSFSTNGDERLHCFVVNLSIGLTMVFGNGFDIYFIVDIVVIVSLFVINVTDLSIMPNLLSGLLAIHCCTPD